MRSLILALVVCVGVVAVTRGELVSSFQPCVSFFVHKLPPQIKNIGSNYAFICQRHLGEYRFATFYDPTHRIPVYSAYTYQNDPSCSITTPACWTVEPQLANQNWPAEMIHIMYEQDDPVIMNSQAVNADYEGSGYDRGHLNPSCHNSGVYKTATYTLTNAAPLNPAFNCNWYDQCEKLVNEKIKDCVNSGRQAYVVTGTIPVGKWLKKDRVLIPDYVWSAYCCADNNKYYDSGACFGQNSAKLLIEAIVDIKTVEKNIKEKWNHEIVVFPGNGHCYP